MNKYNGMILDEEVVKCNEMKQSSCGWLENMRKHKKERPGPLDKEGCYVLS